jgi:hypothetical protein
MNPYLLSYDILGTGRRKPENFIKHRERNFHFLRNYLDYQKFTRENIVHWEIKCNFKHFKKFQFLNQQFF